MMGLIANPEQRSRRKKKIWEFLNFGKNCGRIRARRILITGSTWWSGGLKMPLSEWQSQQGLTGQEASDTRLRLAL